MSDTYRHVDPGWRNTPLFIRLFGEMSNKCQRRDRRSRQHKKHDRFSKYGGINRAQRLEERRRLEDRVLCQVER